MRTPTADFASVSSSIFALFALAQDDMPDQTLGGEHGPVGHYPVIAPLVDRDGALETR